MMKNVLEYFGAVVVGENRAKTVDLSLLRNGYVLDFVPTAKELTAIKKHLVSDPSAKTFFSTRDITELSTNEKILKQVLHYVFVYGFGAVIDFPRNEDGSDTVPVKLLKGITKDELTALVNGIVYANKPAKDTAQLTEIIHEYQIPIKFTEIQNNELRIALYNPATDVFANGDDAVRYICKVCAGSDLLIKSPDVIGAVQEGAAKLPSFFISKHLHLLANVFNRHKRILMALKLGARSTFGTDINNVARWSKVEHLPLAPNPAKTVIADFIAGRAVDSSKLSVRDKFKLLNLIEFKKLGQKSDVFTIRNGRVHVKNDRAVLPRKPLNQLTELILASLQDDLKHLKGKTILFDANVDYGLPVSRKQTLGKLPFGTTVDVSNVNQISSGIYWKNAWGATDIDLSTVDAEGNSTGWGRYSGYNKQNPITFSGDVTSAPDGAMEFMTSSGVNYGLFVSVYYGTVPCDVELVIGERSRDQWIDTPIVREKLSLASKQTIVGFVKDRVFTVFAARTGGKLSTSGGDRIFMAKALSMPWTVKKVFDTLGIAYVTASNGTAADFDLRYANFSIDNLEKMLYT